MMEIRFNQVSVERVSLLLKRMGRTLSFFYSCSPKTELIKVALYTLLKLEKKPQYLLLIWRCQRPHHF